MTPVCGRQKHCLIIIMIIIQAFIKRIFLRLQCAAKGTTQEILKRTINMNTGRILSFFLNCWTELQWRMLRGSEFQHLGPATEKALSPVCLNVRVRGIFKLLSERRPTRLGMLRSKESVMYLGCLP